ncbi:MAG: MauE/DoxX family redox-associated membrane protein [Actinomycetota bacterium]
MTVAATAISLALGLVFGAAVYAHLTDPVRVGAVAGDLGLPRIVAWVAAGLEAVLVVLLVASPRLGGLATVAYLAALMVVFGVARLSGREIVDCGCFKSKHPVSARWYARNLLLAALALTVGFRALEGLGSRGLLAALVVGAAATGLVVVRSVRLEIERTATRSSVAIDRDDCRAGHASR